MKEKIIRMLTHSIIFLLVCIGAVLAMADQVTAIPFIPAAWTKWWGVVLGAATAIKPALLFIGDWLDDGLINRSFKGLPIAVLACLLASCANTADPVRNAANRAGNQAVLNEAVSLLGHAAVSALVSYGKAEISSGGNADFASSAAAGLWSQVDFSSTAAGIGHIVSAYSGGKMPMTASVVQDIAAEALAQGHQPTQIASAIATVLSVAAAK